MKMLYKRDKIKLSFNSSCLDTLDTETTEGQVVINVGNNATNEPGSYLVQDDVELAKKVVFN